MPKDSYFELPKLIGKTMEFRMVIRTSEPWINLSRESTYIIRFWPLLFDSALDSVLLRITHLGKVAVFPERVMFLFTVYKGRMKMGKKGARTSVTGSSLPLMILSPLVAPSKAPSLRVGKRPTRLWDWFDSDIHKKEELLKKTIKKKSTTGR